jgi:hypothetical protein
MSFAYSTSIEKEAEKNRFHVHLPSFPFYRDPVVRPFCVYKQGVPIRVNPTQKDKFKYTTTYKLYPEGNSETHKDSTEYEIISGSALPDGNYLFIITDSEIENEHALVLSRVYSNDIELGSRHSIMPDELKSQVYSAGELRKKNPQIDFNFKSYTFGDSLVADVKESKLGKITLGFLSKVFPDAEVKFNKYFSFEIKDEDFKNSEDNFGKACASMQKFDSMEVCKESLGQKAPFSASNACAVKLTLQEEKFAHKLANGPYQLKEYLYGDQNLYQGLYRDAWKLVRAGEDDLESYIFKELDEARAQFETRYTPKDSEDLFYALRNLYVGYQKRTKR